MRNKLILVLLAVFIVGSIAGITAYSSHLDDKYKLPGAEVQRGDAEIVTLGKVSKPDGTYLIYGQLRDKESDKPIPKRTLNWLYNCKLGCGNCNYGTGMEGNVITDNNGEFDIYIKNPPQHDQKWLTIGDKNYYGAFKY